MFKKTLLPVCTLSSFFFVVSCGGNSSNPSEHLGGQTQPIAEDGSLSNDAESTNLNELDSQLADFSRVNDSETVAIEGQMEESLTNNSPLSQFTQNGIYIVTMYPLRDDTGSQFISHQYCVQKSDHFSQCVLFDGNTQSANLSGVKYIISQEAFELLPAEERKNWHPENFSILSGQLIAPGRSPEQEQEIANMLLNSYSKTWQTWKSIQVEREADPIPLGEAHLGWSFNADGQARDALINERDQKLNVDRSEIQERRQDLVNAAQPQCGIDVLESEFEMDFEYIPGVSARTQEECYAARGQTESEGETGVGTDKSPEDTTDQPSPDTPEGQQPEAPEGQQPEEPAEQSAQEPADQEPAETPEEPTGEEPVGDQTEESLAEQGQETAEGQTEEPPGDQPEEPVGDQTEEPADKPSDQPVGDQTEESAGDQPEEPIGDQTEEPADQPADQPADEPTEEEPVDQQAEEESEDKPVEQAADDTNVDIVE
ncbi:MAG: DUF1264 domain-containing protein [Oligoflexus sp.]